MKMQQYLEDEKYNFLTYNKKYISQELLGKYKMSKDNKKHVVNLREGSRWRVVTKYE